MGRISNLPGRNMLSPFAYMYNQFPTLQKKLTPPFVPTNYPNIYITAGNSQTIPKVAREHSYACMISSDLAFHNEHDMAVVNEFDCSHLMTLMDRTPGSLGVVSHGKNYLYFMFCKQNYWEIPKKKDLTSCLTCLKEHAVKNEVDTIFTPRLGLNFDSINFYDMLKFLHNAFNGTNINIISFAKVENNYGIYHHKLNGIRHSGNKEK